MKRILCLVWLFASIRPAQADPNLPIREVTVFKDGHAFVLHEGSAPVDEEGRVVLGGLPNPVLGTFWAYSADPAIRLKAVTAGRDKTETATPAESLLDLIKANVGGAVEVTPAGREAGPFKAAIQKVLTPAAGSPLVLFRTDTGVRAMALSDVRSVTFEGDLQQEVLQSKDKARLALTLDWGKTRPASEARVGMSYVQLGLRWIPSYRVRIDGEGRARVQLQATLVNELADLDGVKAHLVIGVPRFAFEDEADPISLQGAVTQLSRAFQQESQMRYSLSNAVMSQQADPYRGDNRPADSAANVVDLGPEIEGARGAEDLFVFSLDRVTLKKGHRMVVPLAEFDLSYEDVYVLDLPFAPPMELRQRFDSDQQLELAKRFHAPKAMHVLRLKNTSNAPLTTAPALILKDETVLAQGLATYTPKGGTCDLEVTEAVNVSVDRSDTQIETLPNAVTWNGDSYARIRMQGTVALANFTDRPIHLEVRRSVLGRVDEAALDGKVTQAGQGDDGWAFEEGVPFWWSWYNWPWWWYHFNTIGRVTWDLTLEPSKDLTLTYRWSYYWRP